MIKSFRDKGTEDIFDRQNTREARHICPQQIWRVAQQKLDQLNGVVSLESLRIPPANFLEALKDDRKGQQSIRINDQSRICFVWTDDGAENVEITDYH
ncbi:MAG: plasmid maintenance system killer protein [Nitrospirae bacterium CG_4_10_14_0_8_um_filter_41_23]|nr:plasmid maintenance system killer protein [Nitrospirota bacterium]OIP60103.1 MAG: plasmid maintenance system killer protein [Nitrospirae bacterium CG2_30_41_42]PIQ95213.1 MAG: plasmid maintenance system killer protein [Nitrospirae bacterium CG11_big_fil_rev_8_21_14_0_20_41_14]PIV43109.1 MAG: plasmid maintenance system killer protein [Nitrospirae bacterium CG02_land_8_20_14_3_00_41_53]PIW86454.1 MAG: plasmid maintenance system killer protein [Nitrospirae bacterium CG_4_8_14_3_um_filter_41_47]